MKLKIYNEDEKEEKELTLRLVKDSNNDIDLCAVNKDGIVKRGGILLSITSTGRLMLGSEINPNLGLLLDCDGALDH